MKLAYIILCHKNAAQVKRLVDRLNVEGTRFVLHVSTTCEPNFWKEINATFANYTQVYFCKREDGTHNGFGIVEGIINALELLLHKKIDFDYVNLLSGQDYPIKSNQQIQDFFSKNAGKEFLDFFPIEPLEDVQMLPKHPWGNTRQLYRINRYHFKIDGVIRSIPELNTNRLIDKSLFTTLKIFLRESLQYRDEKRWWREAQLLFWSRVLPNRRPLLSGITYYGGKTWWSFTKDCTKFIVEEHQRNKSLRDFFRYTLIPDEMYFQTMLLNSSFKESCVNDSLRFIKWEADDGTHPAFLGSKYHPLLIESKALFARKFDALLNADTLHFIDQEILQHDGE